MEEGPFRLKLLSRSIILDKAKAPSARLAGAGFCWTPSFDITAHVFYDIGIVCYSIGPTFICQSQVRLPTWSVPPEGPEGHRKNIRNRWNLGHRKVETIGALGAQVSGPGFLMVFVSHKECIEVLL